MTFPDPLIVEPCHGCGACSTMFELHVPFRFIVMRPGMRALIVVPKTFKTDFASIPRMLWPILPPHGRYCRAAVVHDYLYSVSGNIKTRHYTRAECDLIFRDAMAELGVSWITSWAMWAGVRIGGWFGWAAYRDDKAESLVTM